MRSAFVFLSVAATALAQLTVNTPTGAINCLNQAISWVGGTPPYTIQIQPGGDPTQAAIETFTGITASPYTWFVTEPANTQVFIRLRDNSGTTAESGVFTIRAGGTCTSTPAAPGGSSSTPAGGASSAPVTPPAGTATPPAGGSSTPAPGTTGGSGSSSAATTRSTTSTNAAVSSSVAGGVAAVLVGGVVALLA